MWLTFAVAVLILVIFLLGSFVVLRAAKSGINQAFAALSFAIATWMACNFLGANFKDHGFSLYATKLDFIVGCLLVSVIWVFSAVLLSQADERRTHTIWYRGWVKVVMLSLPVGSAVATLLPAVMKVVKPVGADLEVIYGSYFFVYTVGLAIVLVGVVINFFLTVRLAKGRLRQQVGVMLSALVLSVLFVGFANLVLPQFSTAADINLIAGNLSYIGSVFFLIATFYSIVRHRLFDLRLVLARSIAYLLLTSVLVGGYIVLTLLISSNLIESYELTGRQAVVPIVSILLLSLTMNPLLKFLSRITSRVFYKDSYEPQQFLGDLNKVIISRVDMTGLQQGATRVMEQYLKVYFAVFDLPGEDGRPGSKKFDARKMKELRMVLSRQGSSMVLVDELLREQEGLRKYLEGLNVAAAVRLSAAHGQGQGYLLLGSKKNGSAYTAQDVDMLRIASGELAIAIQNATRFEEIEQFNKTLQEKVDEATKKLRQTNERLRVLDQTKDDFISMASHQLRTPLTSVKGYVSMVLDGDGGKINETQRKLLTQSFLSSQRMVYLISDLLNVSRLKTGKFIIEPVESNLANVIEEEVAQLTETVKARGLELSYHKPDNFPTLWYDETKIRQVLMNFIDNAIYYTPEGGQINVYLVDKPNSIEFTVVDDGIGVPKHEQHHLFSKFYRAKNAKSARPDGTGLGLFMAKKVVVAQGGAIIFSSTEGKGSTFGFTFPKAKLTPVKQEKTPAATSR